MTEPSTLLGSPEVGAAPTRLALSTTVVRIAGLWVLAGALFKLFLGTPADLPQVVRELPFDLGLTYKRVITIEMCVAAFALLRPRWGAAALVLLLLVFDAVLVSQIAQGAATCGCFGSKITMPPWLMLVIDSALLIAILFTRAWRRASAGLHPALLGAACAVGLLVPWLVDREAASPDSARNAGGLQRFVVLDLKKMVGQSIEETDLGKWVEGGVHELPPDGLWILYRWTCEHCAAHLERLVANPTDQPFLVLVRLKEKGDAEANQKVFVLPSGPNVIQVSMPDTVKYVITTPGELVLQGGRILSAREAAHEPN